ncbi:FRG domain-containing protein [Pontibacter pamirensis]|uniref:FRG domain-containing protein n=1 Tax=Pontibacter pamirensis TaxID=2562824 RepID=UPI00138969FE|nr:FRG domain-containing protein [Pontibacter pamirensis]
MISLSSDNKEQRVTSVSEYITVILEKRRKLEPERDIWFRGHASVNYSLWPSLYRETLSRETKKRPVISEAGQIHAIEMNIDASFSRKAFSFFSKRGIPDTPWYRYFLKQHYKLRTRLLDWTESALIALFFALEDKNEKVKGDDARVLILAPGRLNNYSINKLLKPQSTLPLHIIPTPKDLPEKGKLWTENGLLNPNQLLRKYYRLDCSEGEEMYPIALHPPHLDERMSAQQACFTLFGNVVDGLATNDSNQEFLDHVCINANYKLQMLEELKVLGINNYSVYPDLDGLGQSINDDFYMIFNNSKSWDGLGDLLS